MKKRSTQSRKGCREGRRPFAGAGQSPAGVQRQSLWRLPLKICKSPLQKGENGQAKADALLKLYNKKTRNLKLTNVFGDNRVRAGSLIVVNLSLGDVTVKNFMLVEKCTHTYKESEHWMDLTLRGGEFVA